MHRLTQEEKEKIVELYELGMMDSEIGKTLNINRATINYFRKSHNLKTKFTYDKISKIDDSKFKELFNTGLSDYAIAKELNMSPDGIYSHRMRHHYIRSIDLRLNDSKPLTDYQKNVLIGTLLGDSSMRIGADSKNPSITCSHGLKQKEYCQHKTIIFHSLGAKCNYHKRNVPDKRTGKIYEDYTMFIPANPELLKWYKALYKNRKKVIPFEILENFNEISLAFLYMDDGFKMQNGYSIATNCFTLEELQKFRIFLLEKFNLETSIHSGNRLYILHKSKEHFYNLIEKEVIETMRYKL